jgi:hypothetical protein
MAITHQILAELHFEVLKHPAYPPELSTLDYWLSPNLKEHLKGREFSNIEEATLAADGWFATQSKAFFLGVLKNVEQRSHKCVEFRKDMCSKYIRLLPLSCASNGMCFLFIQHMVDWLSPLRYYNMPAHS